MNDKVKQRLNSAWGITKFVAWLLGSIVTLIVFGDIIYSKKDLEEMEEKERQEEARKKAKEERERQEREEAERIRRASLTPEQRKIEDLEKELARTNERCDSLQNKINRQDMIMEQQQREREDMDYEIRKLKGDVY